MNAIKGSGECSRGFQEEDSRGFAFSFVIDVFCENHGIDDKRIVDESDAKD